MVDQHPAKFGDHRHCGSRDMMVLVRDGMSCPNTRNFWTYTQQIACVANERLPILVTRVYVPAYSKLLRRVWVEY